MKKLLLVGAISTALLAGTAYAAEPQRTDDYNLYSFTYKCDGFRVGVEGLDTGTHTIYFDNAGNRVRNVAHHHTTETHTNLQSGRTVEFRGDYTSTYEYATDTQSFVGAFLIANEPMEGHLLLETGLAEFNNTTGAIRTAGRHDILELPYDPFCAALAR